MRLAGSPLGGWAPTLRAVSPERAIAVGSGEVRPPVPVVTGQPRTPCHPDNGTAIHSAVGTPLGQRACIATLKTLPAPPTSQLIWSAQVPRGHLWRATRTGAR